MLLSSKLLCIGRLAEFADSNISLRIAYIEITPSDGRSHRGCALLPGYTSPMLQEPAQPAQRAQRGSGCQTSVPRLLNTHSLEYKLEGKERLVLFTPDWETVALARR